MFKLLYFTKTKLVLSYVFFGIFYLVDDMDKPLDYSEQSLINANIEPLEEFNKNH
jgi:hypothetical protein